MHRVELKGKCYNINIMFGGGAFLMHRVELKVWLVHGLKQTDRCVPNVPCGVESFKAILFYLQVSKTVPNVPCGVESSVKFHS